MGKVKDYYLRYEEDFGDEDLLDDEEWEEEGEDEWDEEWEDEPDEYAIAGTPEED